jgi:thiol-disulfide isomerase/thioredoxin
MSKPLARVVLMLVALVVASCGAVPESGETTAQGEVSLEIAELVGQMRDMAWAEQVDEAQALLEGQREFQDTESPAWLLAASWLGRGASFAENWDVAGQYAQEAYEGSEALLESAEVDLALDRQVELALGAGIEVLGQAQSASGDHAGSVEFLTAKRERYRGTSVEMRIQKNVMLLSLEGQPFPVLDVEHHLGEQVPSQDSLNGKVVVAFFWAHWCPDCKRQLSTLQQLHEEYGDQGLAIVGPTQLYGYIARGEDATPEQELAYLRGDYQQRYPIPSWMSAPVSQQNFLDFGVSTTPTLVVIDREGIVRLYNPGDLPYEELSAQVARLL